MMNVINVPPKDKFQVITEHDENSLIFDLKYLNIPRTSGFILIQITLNEGRTGHLGMGSLNTWNDPFGPKGYKWLDTLAKHSIISTDVLMV